MQILYKCQCTSLYSKINTKINNYTIRKKIIVGILNLSKCINEKIMNCIMNFKIDIRFALILFNLI